VLAAAVEVFARDGLAGASVRDIARAARIRVSSLYHHFPSKEALYQAVQARVDDEVFRMVVGVMARSPDLGTMTREVVGGIFDFFRANRAYARLNYRRGLDGPASFEAETRMSDRWLGMAEASIKPARVKGQVKGVDTALFMISMHALVHWHMVNDGLYRRILGRGLDDPATARRAREHIIQIALRTLGLE
jgi:AcrR family transcriptional regulator